MIHSSWMCCVGGIHETSRRRGEFGAWGRSYVKEKGFVPGRHIEHSEGTVGAESSVHYLQRLAYSELQPS